MGSSVVRLFFTTELPIMPFCDSCNQKLKSACVRFARTSGLVHTFIHHETEAQRDLCTVVVEYRRRYQPSGKLLRLPRKCLRYDELWMAEDKLQPVRSVTVLTVYYVVVDVADVVDGVVLVVRS